MDVKKRTYDGAIDKVLCSDEGVTPPALLKEERPVSGIVELRIKEAEKVKSENGEAYLISMVLKRVRFAESTIDYLLIENVRVGWLPG